MTAAAATPLSEFEPTVKILWKSGYSSTSFKWNCFYVTGSDGSFLKVARSRRTEGTGSVQGAVLRTDTSSIRPRIIPDFSKCGKIRRPRGGIFVGMSRKGSRFVIRRYSCKQGYPSDISIW